MTDDDGLLNPYLGTTGVPAVRGMTLSGVGLAAAGVLVVAVGPTGVADAPVDPSTEVWIGAGPVVEQEISEHGLPAGYLWPAPPPAEPQGSPALA